MTRLRVETDPVLCAGSGMCALLAPEVFDQDEKEGTVVLIDDRPAEERRAAVLAAAERCPAGAIRVAGAD
ncbi:ferredoxin [Streptomyces sp. MP131-18]|uniref:ferredoxin n=1 Tax=Streptomyces sp. MP131-18 TaxID=1857892 RepID=UPI00097C5B9A|nr:ferredoxin [Streptomyces sp. MP131-18]ONK15203.1 Ferredoxin-2 [Streptomyces sp. MP131-18]